MNDLASMVGVPQRVVADLIGAFAHRGWTLAAAESLTGGLFTALLTEVPGSSAVVRGALVVYATDLKHRLAGVDPVLLAERGPVDPQVAAELADGAPQRCGATVGIGLTGVAGPGSAGRCAGGHLVLRGVGPGWAPRSAAWRSAGGLG